MDIRIKRVYEPASPDDGRRFLVDRLWPRGVKKDALQVEGWLKDAAPSNALRGQFHHDPERWEDFKRAYFAELDANTNAWQPLAEAAQTGVVTLLYAAKEERYNNASALREYLINRIS